MSSQAPLSSGLPLLDLTEQMGRGLLSVLHAAARPAALHGVVFYDSDLEAQQLSGQLVILTAHRDLTPARLGLLCRALHAAGASGIVARSANTPEGANLVSACATHDLSLLELDSSVGWREFDALVSRLLGEHGAGLQLGSNSSDKLFSLANTVAQTFRGSVAIEDHRRNILAYSALPGQAIDSFRANGILTRRAPDGPLNEARYRQVFATDGISRFPTDNDYAPRAAVPVRAGNIPLGSIWVIDPDGEAIDAPLTSEKREVLESAALLAAGYIVDAWRFEHGDERSKEAALRRVLSGTAQENDATVLGIRPDQQYLVMAVDSGTTAEGDLSEIRTAASRHFSVYFPGSVCTIMEGDVIALLPSGDTEAVKRSLERLLPELARLSGSRCHAGLTDVRRASPSFAPDRERASQVAHCARMLNLDIAVPEDVQPQLILQECGAALRSAGLTLPETAALLGESESETRDTLLAWFEEQGRAPRVAERLNLHEQTVRYRIRRAFERFGLDGVDADRLLVLWLQLRLSSIEMQAGPPTARSR